MSKEISMDKSTISKAFNKLFFDFLDVLFLFIKQQNVLILNKSQNRLKYLAIHILLISIIKKSILII